MADLFSKRQQCPPDVYQYDTLPAKFRRQVVYILMRAFGPDSLCNFQQIHDVLAEEYGEFQLPGQDHHYQAAERSEQDPDYQQIILDFLLLNASVAQVLDVIELSFYVADVYSQEISAALRETFIPLDESITLLNARFHEHGIGYRFESGKVVRVDSEFIHQEAVRPALHVLQAPPFKGAKKEFLRAHEHYRHKRFEESINESLKALESTLKVICTRQGWAFDEKRDTASTLIKTILDHNLVPQYLQTHLESGVPAIRNRTSAHGSGTTPHQVPEHLAAYTLHLTASAIVFLAEAERVNFP